MTGGMRRMGAGRKALVMAVSLTARWAAMIEVPTSCPVSSTTAIPSLSSLFLINTAFSVLAVAGEREREAREMAQDLLMRVLDLGGLGKGIRGMPVILSRASFNLLFT